MDFGGFYHGNNIGAGSPLLPERFPFTPPPRGRGDNAVFPTTVVLYK
jgi:hypothetical protein